MPGFPDIPVVLGIPGISGTLGVSGRVGVVLIVDPLPIGAVYQHIYFIYYMHIYVKYVNINL